MNNQHIIKTLAVAAMTAFVATSCDKSQPQMDNKTASEKAATAETKIAYVEVDSIMTQYTFCKEYSLILQKKGQNIQNTLTQKQQQLETAATNFQQKLQQNAYTREQAEAIQAQLQKQDNDIRALNQRLSTEFQNETDKFNKALRDSISNFLRAYNKEKKFSIILSKAGDNILYADKVHDITNEVIAGLNKAYKPAKAKKETDSKSKK